MNQPARTWRQRVMPILMLSVLTVFTCVFQACTSCENQLGFKSSAQVALQESGGDGRPIDGKPQPGTYYHFVPGLKCNDLKLQSSTIEVTTSVMRRHDIDPLDCTDKPAVEVSLQDLDWSAMNPEIIGSGSGTYQRLLLPAPPALASAVASLNLPEAWCRLRRSDFALDLVVMENRETREMSAKVSYLKRVGPSSQVGQLDHHSVSREGAGRQLKYSVGDLSLNIDRSVPASPGTFLAHVTSKAGTSINGIALDDAVECRTGAEFDPAVPAAPSFSFNLSGGLIPSTLNYARLGAATYFAPNGNIAIASDNVPRFDFDSTSARSRGLLMEEARTNLIVQSADYSAAAWIHSGMLVAEDGQMIGLDRFRVVANDPTATQIWGRVAQQINIVAGQTYALSFFAGKGNQNSSRVFVWYGPGSEANVDFDLASGTSVVSLQNVITVKSTSMDPVAGGFRIGVVFESSSSGQVDVGIGPKSITVGDYIYSTGAQLEVGASASSYIPTLQAAATRGADSLTVADLSWFQGQQGTLHSAITPLNSVGSSQIFSLAGSGSDAYTVSSAPGALYSASLTVGASSFILPASLTGRAGPLQPQQIALTYGANDTALSLNGGLQTGASSQGLSAQGLSFGGTGAQHLNGYVRAFTYWNERINNQSLVEHTR